MPSYKNKEKIFTAAKDETNVWSHTLAELASRNWSAYPVHLTEPRSRLVGKTGIGALEDVGTSLGTVAQSWR